MRRSITYHQHAATDPARDEADRDRAATNTKRLPAITELHRTGRIAVLDLMPAELKIFANATSPRQCSKYGLLFPLDPGEAACLAIALNRDLTFATDDGDASPRQSESSISADPQAPDPSRRAGNDQQETSQRDP